MSMFDGRLCTRKTPIVLAALCIAFLTSPADLHAECGDYVMIGATHFEEKSTTVTDGSSKPERQCLGAYCQPLPDSSSRAAPVSTKIQERLDSTPAGQLDPIVAHERLLTVEIDKATDYFTSRIFHPPR